MPPRGPPCAPPGHDERLRRATASRPPAPPRGRVARERLALPHRRRARGRRNRSVAQPRTAGVQSLEEGVATAAVDQVPHLVVVDGDPRAQLAYQRGVGPRLGLRQGRGTGVVGVEGTSHRPPAVGEVAVEVHPARVLARARSGAVGVELVHQPQCHAARRPRTSQAPGDCPAGQLVAVYPPHDEHLDRRASTAQAHRPDRVPAHRAANDHRSARRACGRLVGGGRRRARRQGGAYHQQRDQGEASLTPPSIAIKAGAGLSAVTAAAQGVHRDGQATRAGAADRIPPDTFAG